MTLTPVTIVAFGDSITLAREQPEAGRWPELVRGMLQKPRPDLALGMVNAGVGGNTSREGLARLEKDVLAHRPTLVAVEFGGNDSVSDPKRHVPLEEYVDNLERMRRGIQHEHGAGVILLTFPPIVNAWHSTRNDHFYDKTGGIDGFIEDYRAATRIYARERGLPLADIDLTLRAAMAADGPGSVIMPDGVHLTAAGNVVVAETVAPVLALALKNALQ
jgi:lysophospholipase L1-like esterase